MKLLFKLSSVLNFSRLLESCFKHIKKIKWKKKAKKGRICVSAV